MDSAEEREPLVSEHIKFNVIIPTRERADTLYHSLRTVVEQKYDNLNIIVSDNYSQDNTREVVASFSDKRIKYINTGKRISMSHNWEFALSYVTDGWVTFLGDDDGMWPGGLKRVAEVIAESKVRAIVSRWDFYFWPQSNEYENQLIIPLSIGYEERDCKVWLLKLMKGHASYSELPYVYTGGFADVELINAARNKNGQFFCSMIPDVYSAVALASVAERYVMMNEPVCVMGVSRHSGGAAQFGTRRNQEPAEKFFSEKNIPFHSTLGSERIRSMHIVIYESYLQSAHLHHDALRIDIYDQLALALTRSSDADYDQVSTFCDEILARNGLRREQLEKALDQAGKNSKKWQVRFEELASYFKLRIDAGQYSVSNVYGAALVSKALHQFHFYDKYWRVKKILRLPYRIVIRLLRYFNK